jgi:hypothetical protein
MRINRFVVFVFASAIALSGCVTTAQSQSTAEDPLAACIDWDVNSGSFASVSVTNWEDVQCTLNSLAAAGLMPSSDVAPIVNDIKTRYSKVREDAMVGYFSATSGQVGLQGNVAYSELIYISDFNIVISE